MGLRVQGLGLRVQGLGFGVWSLGFRVWGLRFRVWSLVTHFQALTGVLTISEACPPLQPLLYLGLLEEASWLLDEGSTYGGVTI